LKTEILRNDPAKKSPPKLAIFAKAGKKGGSAEVTGATKERHEI